jgi:hypothetical protein
MDSPAARQVFLCPGSRTHAGALLDVDEWTDYIYVEWSGRYNGADTIPAHYPLLYDRRAAHHLGSLYVMDCAGRVIWDQNGAWLRRFDRDHKEYRLQLPDDLMPEAGAQ